MGTASARLAVISLVLAVGIGCASGDLTDANCSPSNGTALIVRVQSPTTSADPERPSAVVRAKLLTLRPPPPSNDALQNENVSLSRDASPVGDQTADVRIGGSTVLSLTPGVWSIEVDAPGFRRVSTSVAMRDRSLCRTTISLTER